MQKLPYTILFVVLALVVLNIATLRQLERLEKRIQSLEQKTPPPAAPAASR
jgi:hypothetical protein